MARYIIADPDQGNGWGHLFDEAGTERNDGISVSRERTCRFVYDKEEGRLIHLDIHANFAMNSASAAEAADVEDSLKNANAEALEDPESWGLIGSDDLPEWCRTSVKATPRP